MMNKNSTKYTFMFALGVCLICSLALALVSEGLRKQKELNAALDVKKNILKAVDLKEPLNPQAKGKEVLKVYTEKIKELVVDAKGNIVEGKLPEDIQEGEPNYPLYIYEESGKTMAYAFPIIGKGLWGPLHGYFALEPDAITIRGITYYVTPDFKETPGLGAEVTKDWFQDNFKGKTIWDVKNKELVPIVVVKGKVADSIPVEKQKYYVDGVSGATMTGKGVNEMLAREIKKYEPFLSKKR